MSVPTALASTITTIRIGTATAVTTPHQPLTASAPAVPGSTAVAASSAECSAYYGQKPATDLPKAYGRRINWAPCGYTPTQVRDAYGATRSGLTGAGTTVAVLSGYADPTALTDADQWSRQQEIPQFASGQFTEYDGSDAGGGSLDENTLDLEAVHGMAPAADVAFVVGGDEIPDDPLLDALNTVVQQHLAEVVTSSYYEHFMPAPTSMITSWKMCWSRPRSRASRSTPHPATSAARRPWSIRALTRGSRLWAAPAWRSGPVMITCGRPRGSPTRPAWPRMAADGQSWSPAPPGTFTGGSTGGVSETFA